jgi:uncharacterized membrane protein required for colicin V production
MSALEGIHWLDATIVVVLVLGALLGACTGALRQLVRLATYVAALYAALHLHEPVAEFLAVQFREPGFLRGSAPAGLSGPRVASFAGTLFVVYLGLFTVTVLFQKAVKALFSQGRGTAIKALGLQTLDRLLGAAVGAVLAAILTGTAVLGLSLYPDQRVQTSLAGSQLRPAFLKGARAALAAIPQKHRNELNDALRWLDQAARGLGQDLRSQGPHDAADLVTGAIAGAGSERQGASGVPGPSGGPAR